MANLFRMLADIEDGELVFQRNTLPEVEFKLFILKWKVSVADIADFRCIPDRM